MNYALKALILGLSAGMFCFGCCMTVAFPLFFGHKNSGKGRAVRMLFQFLSGRMVGYITFGAAAGLAGQKMSSIIFQKISYASIIVLAVLLIVHSLVKLKDEKKLCTYMTKSALSIKLPFIFGLLTGLNVCPSFLLAATYVFQMGQILKGVVFFFVFFLSTSVYMIPLLFGKKLSAKRNVRWIANATGVLAGSIFFIIGIIHFSVFLK